MMHDFSPADTAEISKAVAGKTIAENGIEATSGPFWDDHLIIRFTDGSQLKLSHEWISEWIVEPVDPITGV